MEVIQYNISDPIDLPVQFMKTYLDVPFAIFDIETTGLNPQFNQVILIGILYVENGQIVIEQFFAHNRKDEFFLLREFIKRIRNFSLTISYNGNAFDIPFLNKRFLYHKLDFCLSTQNSLDLLKITRAFQKTLKLENYKLKSVEKYLGIYRNDLISGKDSIELYNQFEKTGSDSLKKLILLHNHDDLYYLSKSLMLLDHISYGELIEYIPMPFFIKETKVGYISSYQIKNNSIHLRGIYKISKIGNYYIHEHGFSFEYHEDSQSYSLKIPLYKGTLSSGENCLYINIFDFPFPYSRQNLEHKLPENIVLIRKESLLLNEEIFLFAKTLLQFIFQNLNNIDH